VRERTEALERAKAAAEEANRGKTRFVAAANHDLLQPLNAARLFLAALDESLGEGKGEAPSPAARLRQLTANTVSALRSAEQMLEALLDAAALESGAIEARPGSFAINELLDQLRLEFQPLAEERGLALRVLPSSAIVHSDPRLLRRILQNLLANAVRYTPKGRILVGCRRQGLALRVEVQDTGEGIDEARFAEVFEEYRQAPSSRSLRGDAHGQGLGLAIVDRMSRLLGHPVSLRSKRGRGTAFGVTVPLAAEMAVSASCGPAEPGFALAPPRSSLLVLCVEDDERTLRAVDALLSSWGHRAVLASDRAAAIEALGERIPDAVLIDHHLGSGPSGPEVLAALRRAWGQSPPALFTTADRSGAVRAQARAQGCELLAKPVKPAALKRFLAAVALRRGASLHAAAQP
jgi:CheY-like chemotaxis protein/anti-sigma regulatory factor (Ser/Thr protein kinase)